MSTQTESEAIESPSDSEDQTSAVESQEVEQAEGEEVEAPASDATDDEAEQQEVVPMSALLREKNKYKKQAREAQKTAADYEREIEALRQEKGILQTALGGGSQGQQEDSIPLEYDFDDPAEYRQAMNDYIAKQSAKNAEELLLKREQERQQAQQSQLAEEAEQQAIVEFYEGAAELGASDFDEVEDKAIEVIGKDLTVQLMNIYGKQSSSLIYHLGKNPKDAQRLLKGLEENPAKGLIEVTRYLDKIATVKSKPAPEPNEPNTATGGSSSNWDAKIEAMRKKQREGTATTNDVIKLKREARAAGWVEH